LLTANLSAKVRSFSDAEFDLFANIHPPLFMDGFVVGYVAGCECFCTKRSRPGQ
jgi:hypothetical protein